MKRVMLSAFIGLATLFTSSNLAHAEHSDLCGPPSTTIPGPPPELILVGQPMSDEWLLCYVWHDIQGQDYAPQRFGDVSHVTFAGYPVECGNAISDGTGTPGIQAEIFATGDQGRQLVRFVYRIQLDGDYINNCVQELQ
jgi:hypothetical protein